MMCVDYKFTISVSLYFSHGHEEREEKKIAQLLFKRETFYLIPLAAGRQMMLIAVLSCCKMKIKIK